MESWMRTFWSVITTSTVGLLVVIVILGAVIPASALRCFRCGQYTDGPGSITPCINYTVQRHLKDCPPELNKQCVKYVNEASTVRECANECVEKRSDSWGTSIYCCSEDACNSSTRLHSTVDSRFLLSLVAVFHRILSNWSG